MLQLAYFLHKHVHVRVGMELGWGGFDRAKLDMLILIRIPFSFHVHLQNVSLVVSHEFFVFFQVYNALLTQCTDVIHTCTQCSS